MGFRIGFLESMSHKIELSHSSETSSKCGAITKVGARRIDALDQWCLRTLLGITWHQFVHNDEVRRITKQPNLTAIIQLRLLSIFGHIACMDDDADAKIILSAPLPDNWK